MHCQLAKAYMQTPRQTLLETFTNQISQYLYFIASLAHAGKNCNTELQIVETNKEKPQARYYANEYFS
jgi:hypothetical protein